MIGRVLVTGHLGYVGTVLTPRLRTEGWQVVGADIDLYAACSVAEPPGGVDCPVADFRDITAEHLAGYDAVVHLAGLSNDPLGAIDPTLTHSINHRAVPGLAESARAAGVRRFIAVSTCSVYGTGAGDAWLGEDAPCRPLTAYAESKLAMEGALLALDAPGFEVIVLRPGTVFGLSPRLRFDLVVNNMVAWALSTGRLQLKSTGQAWRPLLHVADLAHAIASLLELRAGELAHRVFNVGFNDLNLKIIDLAKRLSARMPEATLAFTADAEPDARSYRVDCSRLEGALGDWRPSFQPEAVVDELRPMFAARSWGPDRFEGTALARVAHLRHLLDSGRVDRRLRPVRVSDARSL
ncbi:MAG: SDR family oxidoreductase [Wenzhouxiangella sp.]|nr:SDR family oxidoreductase [Wenzhouxiangella sp.]